ncbi:MAG: PVC-type heme-binding CxxCH protein [Verrucomicrobiota bacterium]
MKFRFRVIVLAAAFAVPLLSFAAAPPGKLYDFPIYKNNPPGRQVSGQHAPAPTPALAPEEARKKFTVPPGFEVRLFASEPEVVNPVAMTWDERGRLWILELYEYPLGAKPGEKPRDRIKILEDTDADGKADKVTVFADGLSLATGILLGNGGVYVGQAPDFLFLQDTDGDDKADKRTVLKTGFGLEDRHELLNGFTWGPDGWLYMTHGVFTHSKVKDPNNPNDTGVTMDAAIGRYHPRTKKFEVFADGTSNPWGMDFDRTGNFFVSACVIDHLFHMAPGALYARQGGTPLYPYAYELLPSIVDHRHHMAAYAGAAVYQGNQYPAEYRGTILIGNIHDNAIHQDSLTPNGSSFKASFIRDFVRANDGWFMPVSTQVGPDGCAWLMDWYDRYPCYQNANADPAGVDREYGRIWRVVYVGNKPGASVPSRPDVVMDLSRLNTSELVKVLEHPNVWQRRQAQRLLSERQNVAAKPLLEKLLAQGSTLEARLAALWSLHGSQQLDEATLDRYVGDKEPAIRTWVARLTGERRLNSEAALNRLRTLADDHDPSVRLAVATAARQYISGSLTVNTPPDADVGVGEILERLVRSSSDGKDPLIAFMIWMASEPSVAKDPPAAFKWLLENGPRTMPLSGQLATKTMRRVCDLKSSETLNSAIDFVTAAADTDAGLAVAALDGLIEGQKGRALTPDKPTANFIARLSANPNPEVASRGQQLGTLWGDALALKSVLARINDQKAGEAERIRAIQTARQTKTDATRDAMLAVLAAKNPEPVVVAAIGALSETGGNRIAEPLIQSWKNFSPAAKRAAAETMISRGQWRGVFLTALEEKAIPIGDLPATSIRALVQSKDDAVRNRIGKLISRYQEADADKLKLISEKRKAVLDGEADLAAGHELAKKTCLVCHKFYDEGAEVGPDLTGVGRSTLDALLHNVIHPNEIIGKGYENVEVETKDGRFVAGRLVEDTDRRVKLVSAGPMEEVVVKSDIKSMRVSEISVMPEGLEQMPEADFRNLIWYILNPPQDNKPLTPQRRKELVGEEKSSASTAPLMDRESVALWNPQWRVIAPEDKNMLVKLPEYAGRKNVLMTHPFDREKPASLEREVEIPAGKNARLTFAVAAPDNGGWELRVLGDGKLLHKQIVDRFGERWKEISVDLSPFAGGKVTLRLENAANHRAREFGYWSNLELKFTDRKLAGK